MPPHSASGNELTLHIVLATVPQRQEREFISSVKTDYYRSYREKSQTYCTSQDSSYLYSQKDKAKKDPVLYSPLCYHILGNYDIACISLIDNFKFAQRLFEPKIADNKGSAVFSPYSFQSLTGIAPHGKDELKDFFYKKLKKNAPSRPYFVGICNLKLNNAILIGNGKLFLQSAFRKTEEIINEFNKNAPLGKKVEFLLLQTFSWFEYSLVLFTDNPDSIMKVLRILRRQQVKDLDKSGDIIDGSLYRGLLSKTGKDELGLANVFADTHTYFGMHADLIEGKKNSSYIKQFISNAGKMRLHTEIEWQVKPGHMHLLENLLREKSGQFPIRFKDKAKYFLAGKSDYLLQEKSASILNNLFLLRMTMEPDSGIYEHVRKLRTRVLFLTPKEKAKPGNRIGLNLSDELKKICITGSLARTMDERMKALKISRQIRLKILKIFTNYNNGIQDAILFPFFLDFTIFIQELVELINEEFDEWSDFLSPDGDLKHPGFSPEIGQLEDALMKRIMIFQEGYYIRMLNCYQFEDITDFDLDFNTSIQQLLSMYSTIAFEIGNMLYDKEYKYGPIIQLNLKETVANYNSINYYINHLTSPEFVFATISKEILNHSNAGNDRIRNLLALYRNSVRKLKQENPYLADMIDSELIDLKNLLIDSARFMITYDMDFELFFHWIFSYNFQHPSLYDKSGMFNEQHFKKELFRTLFISAVFGNTNAVSCPVPELFTYWDRHFKTTDHYVNEYIRFLKKEEIFGPLMDIIMGLNKQTLKVLFRDYSPECPTDSRLRKYITQRTADWGIFCAPDFHDLIQKRKFVFTELSQGKLPADLPPGSPIKFQWYIFNYLEQIYTRNNKVISFLRRDWKKGVPLHCLLSSNATPHLYSIDQTGGIFFDEMSSMNVYFNLSAETLNEILHYSLVMKKKFILAKIKDFKQYEQGK